MLISIARCFGWTSVIITRNHEWYHAQHLYSDVTYAFETLGM